ncbi:hypothetical protein SCUCBS95973_009373 [Sporothrix curviconia]|uniref:Stc1 domain-containing protein n=1 Tax=Sporothrix curviconia TaxID=1260050 RepID=A0ABP0CUE6_9PEZI
MANNSTCTDLIATTPAVGEMAISGRHQSKTCMPDLLGPEPLPSLSLSPPLTPLRLSSSTYSSSSSSSSSSSFSPPTPTPSPPRHKAFYQVTRLDPAEIARRMALGICTYCADDSHSRRMCAQGRLMRKVTKAQLDQRLKRCVCPICGDPEEDKHCKQTCPRRVHVQAILDAKQDAWRKKRGLPPMAADLLRGEEEGKEEEKEKEQKWETVEYETVELRLPTFILKGNVGKAFAASAKSGRPKAAKALPPNLLDAEVTEVVWGNMAILPCERAGSQSLSTDDTDDTDGTDCTDDDDAGGASVGTDDTEAEESSEAHDLLGLDKGQTESK